MLVPFQHLLCVHSFNSPSYFDSLLIYETNVSAHITLSLTFSFSFARTCAFVPVVNEKRGLHNLPSLSHRHRSTFIRFSFCVVRHHTLVHVFTYLAISCGVIFYLYRLSHSLSTIDTRLM